MNNYNIEKISALSVHRVGNKINQELIKYSNSNLSLNDDIKEVLVTYFITPFKLNEYFNFFHDSDISLNEVYSYVSRIFDNKDSLFEQSINIAKHLYEKSTHPKIKSGEFYTVYFKDCELEGEIVDAVGLFKSENKDTFLKVNSIDSDFEIISEKGVNINKLDKGCLIFNTDRDEGYVVAVVDNTNKSTEAQYWYDDFLHVRQRKDEYYNTQNMLTMCKSFVTKELPAQFETTKADQADYLNRSVAFFKKNDNFDLDEFTNEVIAQPDVIESFNSYKNNFQENYKIEIADNFDISNAAVKKQSRGFKSVIKLDKNFHIYVHGNRNMIEQGVDGNGRKYYKIYYDEEQ
ncbi:MAG: nucleoid-associated protein [Bacteroidota bacterium]